MELIDTHCHLTSEAFAGAVDAVIDRAVAAGVRQMITVATDATDARAALALTKRRAELRMAAGIHPHETARAGPGDIEELRRIWSEPLCVAVGEIGLDYHYDFSPRAVQRDLFARQLEAARETARPIIVHSREAHEDTVAILRQAGLVNRPVVFHCFTGTRAEADRISEYGWRISLSGVVTFRKSTELQAVAAACPADRLLLETDSPYLSPEPVRHLRPNEPACVAHIARFVATLRGVPAEELAAQASRNARAFFSLPATTQAGAAD